MKVLQKANKSSQRRMKEHATPQAAAARLKKVPSLCPTLALVLGSGFHHIRTGWHLAKSPLRYGWGWIKVEP
ncbi:MAG TPA: hypothetical protein VMB80_05565 [Candidatus Acidoferrum sp.]|nr:hypothetical protein [Candidatus Acidoferrum sp.]